MTQRDLAVIGLGIVLAILVIPFGGRDAPLGIAVIAALVVLDLWWERRQRPKPGPR